MAKKSKKSGTKRATKKSAKKKSAGKKKPKKKSAKRATKKPKKKSAKKPTKTAKKTEPSSTEKAAAPPAVEPEPDVEPQPPEEPLTPPAPPPSTPEETERDEPAPAGAAAEPERPWAPEDEDTPSDPWDEPPAAESPGAGPGPWEASQATTGEEEEERPGAIPETPPEGPEPTPPEEPEPDPWPSPDDDVVTAEPAAPPNPEETEEAAPWDPVTEEPAPRPEPEPAPSAEEDHATAPRGWQVSDTGETPQEERDQPQRGWPTRAPDRDELRSRFDDASVRMGLPPMAAFGWALFIIGLLLVTYAYYDVYAANADSVLLFAGVIRYDVLGAILLILGLVTALIFHFVPTRRPHGPQPEDSPTKWVARADQAARWVTAHRTLSIIGWGLAIFGLTIATIALYTSWLNSNGGLVDYGITIAGRQFLYWRIGAALAFLGLILVILTYTRIRNAREARQGYLLAALAALDRQRVAEQAVSEAQAARAQTPQPRPRTAERPQEASGAVAGVTEDELQALMKKLDGLMSNLPEQQVAEFANSREAEIYLRLLESSK